MSERIEKTDLISQEALDAIQKLKDDMEVLSKSFLNLTRKAREYNKALTESQSLKEYNKNLREAAKHQNAMTLEAQKFELAQKKMTVATDKFNTGLLKVKENTNTWSKALGSFQFKFNFLGNAVAALSSGLASLGAVVTQQVLKAFVSFFTQSEKGMELMERKVAGFKASMSILSGEFIKLGDAMFGENADKAIKWGNVTKRALQIVAAGANLIPGVRTKINDIADSMNEASQAAEDYTRKEQDLEETERIMSRQRSQTNLQIKEARLAFAANIGTQEEQIAGLQQAFVAENNLADAEMDHQLAVIGMLDEINALKEKSGKFTDADKDKYIAAQNKIDQIKEDSVGRQLRGQMKLTSEIEEVRKRNIKNSTIEAEKILAINKETALAEEVIIDDLIEYKEEGAEEWVAREKEIDKERLDAKKAAAEREKQIEKDKEEFKQELIQATFDLGRDILSLKSAQLNAAMEKELAAAEGNEAKQLQIKKKYAREQQKIEVRNALINSAQAILSIWGKWAANPIYAAILTGVAAIATGVQVSAIKAQKFAKGTKNSPEGVHWVGEKGTELMIDPAGNVGFSPSQASLAYLQKGTKIFPADVTRDLLNTMDYQSTSTRSKERKNELVPLIQALVNKPVTSVTIDNNGITVMNRSEQTLTRRIDKYFRN